MIITVERVNKEVIREEIELLPCPFCKGESEMKVQPHAGSGARYEYTPRCKRPSCAGRLQKKWLSAGEAVDAWNLRA